MVPTGSVIKTKVGIHDYPGSEEYYSTDGSLEKKLTYYDESKRNKREEYLFTRKGGTYRKFYRSGELNFQLKLKNGELHGSFEEHYDNGQLAYVGTYSDGKRSGIARWYYQNGQLKFEAEYKEGLPWNIFKIFDSAGNALASLR